MSDSYGSIDKAPDHLKPTAHTTFQKIAFAYAILSDPIRRKRYDTTGSISDTIINTDSFGWSDYYAEQYKDAISGDSIAKFAKQYKGSKEEKNDLLGAYVDCKGEMAKIYSIVMLSQPSEDEERFRVIIDEAIQGGNVEAFEAYTKETKAQKRRRISQYENEGKEAIQYAEKLGIADNLFNKGGSSRSESSLQALIQKNQKDRANFLDKLEAKYTPEPKSKNRKKREAEKDRSEPSEEAFQVATVMLQRKKEGTRKKDSKGYAKQAKN